MTKWVNVNNANLLNLTNKHLTVINATCKYNAIFNSSDCMLLQYFPSIEHYLISLIFIIFQSIYKLLLLAHIPTSIFFLILHDYLYTCSSSNWSHSSLLNWIRGPYILCLGHLEIKRTCSYCLYDIHCSHDSLLVLLLVLPSFVLLL